MKSNLLVVLFLSFTFLLQGCGSFKAKRVSADESDELAMEITDKWVARDTEIVIRKTLKQMKKHRGFKKYMRKLGREPKLFIGEVQNVTSEPYFPIDDLNDELLNEFSMSGDFILIDAAQREAILKEITYQNDGMVDPAQAKKIGKQSGADLMIFGAVRMKPKSRGGKTIKEYSINFRMTNIESGVEILRTRQKINKFSDQKSTGW
jgi:uncharacterized protein (TIGR02722 family)